MAELLTLSAEARALATRLPAPAPWLADLRGRGLAAFDAEGLPTRRTEAWKYTRVEGLKKTAFSFGAPAVGGTVPEDKIPAVAAHRLVLVNGRLDAALSDNGALPAGVSVQTLAGALASAPQDVEPYLGRLFPLDGYPFAALNTGVLGDGLVIRVADRAVVETALHVVSLAQGAEGQAVAFHPRLLVLVGEGAQATLIESHVGAGEAETLSNGVAEVRVADRAILRHVTVQNEARAATHIRAMQVVVGAHGVYDGFALSFGGKLARADIRVCLDGEGAQATVNGAYAADTGQHMDTTSFIDHAQPHGTSNQVYKGVIDGTGRGVFQGRINVRRVAQKTDGHQLHKALLLSRRAEVDAKPELTIYADDVKCSHGATCGELDADQLFYLRARGLNEAEARALLIEGFLDDVIDSVGDEAVRDALKGLVHGWLLARSGHGGTA